MNDSTKRDLLSQLLSESQSYKRFEDIEKLVEKGDDLSVIPLQPLFISLKNSTSDQIAQILPKLSSEQRQGLRDVDIWKKDELDPDEAMHWLEVYMKVNDDVVALEYAKSEDFLLTLKNQFTISTFDVEDPMYPEHDNYFLTEDNLLLIEYPEDFSHVSELKTLIRQLYGEMGVEHAYAFLFKMVADSYSSMEEENYNQKLERLRDYGFVDYYEALATNAHFISRLEIERFVDAKKSLTPELDLNSQNQNLHASTLMVYQSGLDGIRQSLETVADEKRFHFLQFNFVRLVNSRLALEDAMKSGSLAMSKVGETTKACLDLGFDFVTQRKGPESSVFMEFDFNDLYKIGRSLLEIEKKSLKKALAGTDFEEESSQSFLGSYWNAFIENTFGEITMYKFDGSSAAKIVSEMSTFENWRSSLQTLKEALPFVQGFYRTLENLKREELLQDDFYLNYGVADIDFEAIMISSLINFLGGNLSPEARGKMGVTLSELKAFYTRYFIKNGSEYLLKGENGELQGSLKSFTEQFGMANIPKFPEYLFQVIVEQMNGYEIDDMTPEDFQHVGGPILLNQKKS
jgi:hypothetical protein